MKDIPGFAGDDGLPIGLTAVRPRFSDRRLLYIARSLGPTFEKEGKPESARNAAKVFQVFPLRVYKTGLIIVSTMLGGWVRKEDAPLKAPPRRMSTGYRST